PPPVRYPAIWTSCLGWALGDIRPLISRENERLGDRETKAMPQVMLRRIAFTLGALLIYRAGLYVLVPGIDPAAWDQIFRIRFLPAAAPTAWRFLAWALVHTSPPQSSCS